MPVRIRTIVAMAPLLAGSVVAVAQEMAQPPPPPAFPNVTAPPGPPAVPAVVAPPAAPGAPTNPYERGLEAESLPAEIEEDLATGRVVPRFGPTPVSDVNFLMDYLRFRELFGESGLRTFGWLESGYTGASPGTGQLSVQPRQNRFGNEMVVSQIGWVLQKPLSQDECSLGFNVRYFAGADAALGQPKGGIGSTIASNRFSQDFRDLYLSAHLPILTDGGMDFKIGRMNTIIGYNGFLAPYRPFFSSDYQFFYAQDGAFTGFLTNLHVSDRLEIWNGMTLGANTFFVTRSAHSYCYIGQINYWLSDERRTRLTASVYEGPDAIFAAPGLNGTFVNMVELRVQQNWSERFTQILQNNMGWDVNTPRGTGSFYGLYTIGIYHLTEYLDLQGRAEWFDDPQGTRTGVRAHYEEVTLGLNWHPIKCLDIRPEIRGDFASAPAFGVNGAHQYSDQLTGVISFLVKF
jgi:hypothetical protein